MAGEGSGIYRVLNIVVARRLWWLASVVEAEKAYHYVWCTQSVENSSREKTLVAGVSWYCVPDGELKVSCCLDEGAVQALECKHVLLRVFMCVCFGG